MEGVGSSGWGFASRDLGFISLEARVSALGLQVFPEDFHCLRR